MGGEIIAEIAGERENSWSTIRLDERSRRIAFWLAVAAAAALFALVAHTGTATLATLLATLLAAALAHTGTATLVLPALCAGLLALTGLITTVSLLSTLVALLATLVALLATLVSVCVCHSV